MLLLQFWKLWIQLLNTNSGFKTFCENITWFWSMLMCLQKYQCINVYFMKRRLHKKEFEKNKNVHKLILLVNFWAVFLYLIASPSTVLWRHCDSCDIFSRMWDILTRFNRILKIKCHVRFLLESTISKYVSYRY